MRGSSSFSNTVLSKTWPQTSRHVNWQNCFRDMIRPITQLNNILLKFFRVFVASRFIFYLCDWVLVTSEDQIQQETLITFTQHRSALCGVFFNILYDTRWAVNSLGSRWIWFGLVLWLINHCQLFYAKSFL